MIVLVTALWVAVILWRALPAPGSLRAAGVTAAVAFAGLFSAAVVATAAVGASGLARFGAFGLGVTAMGAAFCAGGWLLRTLAEARP